MKHTSLNLSALGALLLLVALLGVLPTGCLDKHPSAAYTTFLTLYNYAPEDQAPLADYDYIITGPTGYFSMEPQYREKALLYFDIWGSSAYATPDGRETWQPRPGDLGQPDVVLGGVHCFTWDEKHVGRFTGWVRDAVKKYPCAGVFLDDWAADRFWWVAPGDSVEVDLAREVWPFYPRNTWLWDEVRLAEVKVSREVFLALGGDALVVANGPGSQLASTKRMAEHAGSFSGEGKNTWSRMLVKGVDANRYLKEGDFLLEGLLLADGSMDAAGEAHLARMAVAAIERGCAVGIGYRERPDGGGSRYNIAPGKWGQVENWPHYWEPK